MSWWQVFLLAVVQGVTEFLPISSSGHLVVLEHLLPQGRSLQSPALNVFLHLGTLLAILWAYRREVAALLVRRYRLAGLILLGTLPGMVLGLALRLKAPGLLTSPAVAGLMLFASGGLLWWMPRAKGGTASLERLTAGQAGWIGLAQAAALLPGLSRSGSTIAAGLALGLPRREAATFSFLLAVPITAGAVALEAAEIVRQGHVDLPWWQLSLGVVVSFLTGLAALRWLLRWLASGRIGWLAWWCFLLGGAVLLGVGREWLGQG